MKPITQEVSAMSPPAGEHYPGRSYAAPGIDGRHARWNKHREERTSALINTARKLIHEHGPHVTMDDIAHASGTSKSVVYRYFRDKSELQRALGLHLFNAMHRELSQYAGPPTTTHDTAREGIARMVRAFVTTAAQSRNLFEYVTQPSPGLNHFLHSVHRLVASTLPKDMSEAERHAFAVGSVSLVHATTGAWITSEPQHPLHECTAEDITAMIVGWLTHSPLSD